MKQYFELYKIKEGKLYRKLGDKIAWVVPKSCRWQICRLCHDENGHFGLKKTLKKIQESYWFAGMRRFVKKYVGACLNCLYYKQPSRKKQGYLHPIEKVPIPFHTIHIDHLGPFEKSIKGNKYIFVIVDGFTKFCFIEPVKDTSSKLVVKALLTIMYIFSTPNRIISDRGTAFTSVSFSNFCKDYGVRHILNAVSTPRANGQCERYNSTILNSLRAASAGVAENKWDTFVKPVQYAMNTTFNTATGMTAMELLAGFKGHSLSEGNVLSAVKRELERGDLKALRKSVEHRLSVEQKKQKERFDKARIQAKKYLVDDVVMVLKTDAPCTGASRKLVPKYKGPFKVTKVLYNDRYEVVDLRENYKRYKTVVAADKMKPWILLRDADFSGSEDRHSSRMAECDESSN
ncbi:unnamed protein product [Acanthoscelides obtectus]|uniref:RNA-directed DNA polymerase n=1 Tax=Acanthoscelides obtectus TaxID=200917 RepID=A0A9P0M9M1_ACAOB|nr:unnamed protein product [Acanthoscelides obtectus]CAK1685284.1 Pro-Pol polyprotein [Acanthoscelides obtectus]